MKASTERLDLLPDIESLKRICQSIALLDAILQPVWDYRYFSFNSKWKLDENMASMRDGSGDEFFMVFKRQGVIMLAQTANSSAGSKVVEAGHTLPNTFACVPLLFSDVLEEPAFPTDEITFCLWRLATDNLWSVGGETDEDLNNSSNLLFIFDGHPETYQEWAEEYFETDVSIEAVRQIYQHIPLTDDLIKSLNPEMDRNKLSEDLKEIGYIHQEIEQS